MKGRLLRKLSSRQPQTGRKWGQTFVFLAIGLPAFIGAMGLATDAGMYYFNRYKMQEAVDAAVLAGAHCLPDGCSCKSGGTQCGTGGGATNACGASVAQSTASNCATFNGIQGSDTVTGPTANAAAGTVTMTAQRNVPYYFARLVGVTQGAVNVTATAQIGSAGAVFDGLPLGLQVCLPGMTSPCPYSFGTPLTFGAKNNDGSHSWVTGPGTWSPVQGNPTPSDTFSSCPPPAASCTNANPGFAKLKSLIDEANTLGAGAIVCVPMVDWTGCTGSCNLNVYGFAAIQLGPTSPPGVNGGPSGSSIQATFVNSVCSGIIGPGGAGSCTANGNVGACAEKLIS